MAAAVAWEGRRGFAAEYAAARAEIETRAEVKRLFRHLRDRWDKNDPATRVWLDAIARNDLAFVRVDPASFWEALDDLRQAPIRDAASGNRRWTPARPRSVEIAIRFLEADLICFRSGYVKERLIRRLVRQPLGAEDKARLRAVVLSVLDRRGGRDSRAFCRLAARVADAGLDAAVTVRLASERCRSASPGGMAARRDCRQSEGEAVTARGRAGSASRRRASNRLSRVRFHSAVRHFSFRMTIFRNLC